MQRPLISQILPHTLAHFSLAEVDQFSLAPKSATIDRLFDRAEILVFEGASYRLKGRIQLPTIQPGDINSPRADARSNISEEPNPNP